ncbi:glycosyltransferase involved in cell wall biosynthesis [Paenibacillus sp. V4I3]|uniref:glycosyltransferase family 4 protein n=1 Tax=unclassified Paenibacillus TaxID=185978 RepID=UPI0027863526|nr:MULTISPECIES: glycosyltransferase family 4 protein [unclassified Paenibacillus]MDQ0873225.1 glycosyltransferase involved in cell wall biosynthesis [Paenibacillus sp. V4I3]MDQ0890858.1 glycosyltransferase involved in cell wall biosynthesis [Paenibacillus sp. V4I9]
MRIGIFSHTNVFEDFFVKGLGLSEEDYIRSYHNDFSFEYARLLEKDGIETIIYLFTMRGNQVREYKHQIVNCRVKFIPVGMLYKWYASIPFSGRTPMGKYVSQLMATTNPMIKDIVKQDQIDIIYCQEYNTGRFEPLSKIAKSLNIPIIGAYHGGSIPKILLPIKKRTLHNAAFLTTLNMDETNNMLKHFPALKEKIKLIPNFVNTSMYKQLDKHEAMKSLGLDPAQRYLISVGRLFDHQKKHSLLIQAAAQLKDVEDLHIFIAGSGPDEAMLRDLIRQHGVENKVTLLGNIRDKNKLVKYYNASEFFVLPSAYEGLPLVMLEAGACGLPTVAYNVTGVRGLLEDNRNGIIVYENNPYQLSLAIRRLLDNPKLCEAYGKASYDTVQIGYTEDIIKKKLIGMFEDSRSRQQGYA